MQEKDVVDSSKDLLVISIFFSSSLVGLDSLNTVQVVGICVTVIRINMMKSLVT